MRLFGFISRHMVAKIFLATALVLGVSLVFQTARDTRREVDTLKRESRLSAETIARMIIGGRAAGGGEREPLDGCGRALAGGDDPVIVHTALRAR